MGICTTHDATDANTYPSAAYPRRSPKTSLNACGHEAACHRSNLPITSHVGESHWRRYYSWLVPKGTFIVVTVRRSYKSYGASTGTKITYDVEQDVIVNGFVIAKVGDVAEGEILNAHEASTNWFTGEHKGANLRVSVDKVYNFCGDTLDMDFARSEFRTKRGCLAETQMLKSLKGKCIKCQPNDPKKSVPKRQMKCQGHNRTRLRGTKLTNS